MAELFHQRSLRVLGFKTTESKLRVIICALALCFWAGCSPKSASTKKAIPTASPQISFILVEDPVNQLCYDDTASRTEWFNAPVVRFSGDTIDLFGRPGTPKDLEDWVSKYYEHKVERALWVQIAPGSFDNAELALVPLVRMFPDLQIRQVEFGFNCPKIHH